jgi:hypothetical protein
MENKGVFTKILAIAGTVLMWAPALMTVVFAVAGPVTSGRFHFDYLIPAEVFPAVLIGGLLLIWAALRAKTLRKLIIWSFALLFVFLAASQCVAIISGMASGKIDAEGLPMTIALALIILYDLATVELGVAGIVLISRLFARRA